MHTIALFGEAQKGEFQKGYFCKTLTELSDCLGEPPHEECLGLRLAIQAILYERKVLFFRVREEGFSTHDYLKGLHVLKKEEVPPLTALCLPGVGCQEILEATSLVCKMHNSFLIFTEQDLYDYLTDRKTLLS